MQKIVLVALSGPYKSIHRYIYADDLDTIYINLNAVETNITILFHSPLAEVDYDEDAQVCPQPQYRPSP